MDPYEDRHLSEMCKYQDFSAEVAEESAEAHRTQVRGILLRDVRLRRGIPDYLNHSNRMRFAACVQTSFEQNTPAIR